MERVFIFIYNLYNCSYMYVSICKYVILEFCGLPVLCKHMKGVA
jgi:hypothetical protein